MRTLLPILETELAQDHTNLLAVSKIPEGDDMKLLKGLLLIVIIGAVAGFVMSLIAPQMELTPAPLDDDDAEF